MAKDYSFDVVCRTDLQEAANAVNQASKEIGTRYDFKGSKSSVSFDGSLITLIGDDDFKLRLVREIVNGKLVKRGISLKNIEEKKMKRFPFTSLVCLLVTHSTFSQINGHPRMKTLSSLLHFWKLGTPEMESLPSALDHQDHQ